MKIGYTYIWLTIIKLSLWRYTPFSDPKIIVGELYSHDIPILSPLSPMKIAILMPVDSNIFKYQIVDHKSPLIISQKKIGRIYIFG
jgi:hypothetical protein